MSILDREEMIQFVLGLSQLYCQFMKMSQINEEPEEDKELEKQFSTENKVEESQEGEKNSIVNMHTTTQDQAIEEIHMRVRSAIKGECFVRYDLFNYDDDDESIDNLDEIAIQ